MPLYFITGNANKFKDVQSAIPDIQQLDIDLPEIQDIDPKKIVREKLAEAFKHHQGEFLVDDVSLHMEGLHGLPGPLIKWFIKSMGMDGIATLAEKVGNDKATVSAIIAYAKSPDDVHYFEGTATGRIVQPRGQGGFGWDVIFQPDGSDQTFGEWKESHPGEPNAMRTECLSKLKQFLSESHD